MTDHQKEKKKTLYTAIYTCKCFTSVPDEKCQVFLLNAFTDLQAVLKFAATVVVTLAMVLTSTWKGCWWVLYYK